MIIGKIISDMSFRYKSTSPIYVFKQVVEHGIQKSLVGGEEFAIDASLVKQIQVFMLKADVIEFT
jgi:transposase